MIENQPRKKHIYQYAIAYISICDNEIISYTLTIFIREKNVIEYTNDDMRYIGMNTLIKNDIIHCIRKICKN